MIVKEIPWKNICWRWNFFKYIKAFSHCPLWASTEIVNKTQRFFHPSFSGLIIKVACIFFPCKVYVDILWSKALLYPGVTWCLASEASVMMII